MLKQVSKIALLATSAFMLAFLPACSGGSSHHNNKVAVTSITITSDKATLYVSGGEEQPTTSTLTATIAPDNASDKSISWHATNESRVTLSANEGASITVTATNAGPVTIMANSVSNSGVSDSVDIIVYADKTAEETFKRIKGMYTAGDISVTIREDGIIIIDGEESGAPAVVKDDGSLSVEGRTITVTEGGTLTLDGMTFKKVSILLVEPNGTERKFDTIKDALATIPTTEVGTYTMTLQPGTYNENGLSYIGSATVVITGNTEAKYGADVIIRGKGLSQDMQNGPEGRNLLYIADSASIVLKNVTLESTLRRSDDDIPTDTNGNKKSQSEVLGFNSSGTVIAYNSSFKGRHDTLRTTGKAWFYKCYIEGDVDFLWMESTGIVALYEDCEIKMVGDDTTQAYIAAPRMTVTTTPSKGLVVYNSKITVDSSLSTATLARTPWNEGYYNQVAYINTPVVEGNLTSTWHGSSIATEFPKTDIGWKLDTLTAESIGHTGDDDILSDRMTKREYNGRYVILNRVFNTETLKYETVENTWDAANVLSINGVSEDKSKDNIFLDYVDARKTSIDDKLTVTDINGNVVPGVTWSVKAYKKYVNGRFSEEITDKSVTIDSEGKITNNYSGNVYVEVTATKGGASDSIIVYSVTATGITLSQKELSVAEGSTAQLEVSFEPEGAVAEVEWTSSDTNIATVDTNGLVTAKSGQSGKNATITAKIKGTNISETCKVTVTDAVTLKKFGTSVEGVDITKYGTLGDDEYLIYPVPITLDAAGKAEKDFAIEAKINYTSANSGVGVVSFKDGAYSDGEVSRHAFATPGGVKSSAGGNGYDVSCSETSGDFTVKAYVTAGSTKLYFELVDPNGDVHKKDNLLTYYVPDANDYIYLAIGGTTGTSGGMTVSANDITITVGDGSPAKVAKFEDLAADPRMALTASGGASYTIAATETSAKGTKFTIPLTQDMLSGLSVSPSVSGTWSWNTDSAETSNGGDVTATATFIPSDRTKYKAVLSHEVKITVTDNRAVSDKTFVTIEYFRDNGIDTKPTGGDAKITASDVNIVGMTLSSFNARFDANGNGNGTIDYEKYWYVKLMVDSSINATLTGFEGKGSYSSATDNQTIYYYLATSLPTSLSKTVVDGWIELGAATKKITSSGNVAKYETETPISGDVYIVVFPTANNSGNAGSSPMTIDISYE